MAALMLLGATTAFAGDDRVVRLSSDGPGVVRLRGEGIQGVDWPAPGRGSATVPVVVYQAELPVTLNGKPWRPEFVDSAAAAAVRPFDDEAYQQAVLWRPGRSAATRNWLLGAIAVGVIGLGIARHADPRRATRRMLLAALGLAGGAVAFFPKDRPAVTRPASGQPGRDWHFIAARPGDRVEVPVGDDVRYVPRSAEQLKRADPVLRCDAAGKPVALACTVGDEGRAVFIRRKN